MLIDTYEQIVQLDLKFVFAAVQKWGHEVAGALVRHPDQIVDIAVEAYLVRAAINCDSIFKIGFVDVDAMPQAVIERAIIVVEHKWLTLTTEALFDLKHKSAFVQLQGYKILLVSSRISFVKQLFFISYWTVVKDETFTICGNKLKRYEQILALRNEWKPSESACAVKISYSLLASGSIEAFQALTLL